MASISEQPACEHVPISEKGDDGVTVESSLRVPQHLSLAFSTAADAYCSAAYAVAPHSLPTRVQVRLPYELLTCSQFPILRGTGNGIWSTEPGFSVPNDPSND